MTSLLSSWIVIAVPSAAAMPSAGSTNGLTVNVGTFDDMDTSAPAAARSLADGTAHARAWAYVDIKGNWSQPKYRWA